MKTLRVLLVDDDPAFIDFAGEVLTSARYSVSPSSDFDAASAALDGLKGKAVVLSDLTVKKQSALPFLTESLKKYPHIPFTLLARSPSLESVIEALKQGAYDFLRKPVAPDILRHSVARSVEKLNLTLDGEKQERENQKLLDKSRSDLERARNISNFKGFLISATAHDFNSTLTVLDGYHRFIRDRLPSGLEPAVSNLFEQAARSVTRLRTMSSTLLDYEAAERGELHLRPRGFDLNDLLEECVAFYRPYAEQKQIVMDLEENIPSLEVLGDRGRVMQVLDNLLYNAVKFTPAGGEIRVGAKSGGDRTATVWVRDSGVGIPKSVQERLLGNPMGATGKEGDGRVGLGLTICKKLIEAQNGRIAVESAPGKGTVISFTLPV